MKQTILITGVGQRIGFYLATLLADSGYQVVGTYRRNRESLESLRDKGVILYQVDFYDSGQIDVLNQALLARLTSLRAIIHNASEWLSEKEQASESPAEIIEKMMRVHVHAPYLINLALSPLLKNNDSEFSDIIHFSDYVASTGSPKHLAYAASKAALSNLTLSFASALAPRIKVNAIAPGLILFNENDELAYKAKTLKKALIQREGGVEEIAHAVLYLLNSRFVTGRVLPVDGGRHLARLNQPTQLSSVSLEPLLTIQQAGGY